MEITAEVINQALELDERIQFTTLLALLKERKVLTSSQQKKYDEYRAKIGKFLNPTAPEEEEVGDSSPPARQTSLHHVARGPGAAPQGDEVPRESRSHAGESQCLPARHVRPFLHRKNASLQIDCATSRQVISRGSRR